MHMPSDLDARIAELSTADVSDALDRLGLAGQCSAVHGIKSGWRVSGRAFTIRYGPVGVAGGTVGDFIDDVSPGDVVVIDNRGRTDVTVWGDLLTTTAHRNQVAGTVISGVCRDSARSLELDYPIFSCGVWMRTGKDRVCVQEIGGTVDVGGVSVDAGDHIVADNDGVVAIPASHAEAVVSVAEEIKAAEERIRQALAEGGSLREARTAVGYHTLQTAR
ncbi:diguanylate cyclase [Pseudonocardia ailaonensis]|uniref:Putative 4-hydroxy-4-methyl-2-oxoglutarate aldolase n=1 Tax=Pseudonocardia ailaonensis TaxID=367279 RepID=A0ABN2NJM6_9PSEU